MNALRHLLRKLRAKQRKLTRRLRQIRRRKRKIKNRLEKITTINDHGAFGVVIVEEANAADLPLHVACALVEWESGFRNIFGCDLGPRSTVPYCNQDVNRSRVEALLRHIRAGGTSNGVGLTQLTFPGFIFDAEEEGGAEKPRAQCRVGFDIFAGYLRRYGSVAAAYAHFNGGTNPPAVSWDRGRAVADLADTWNKRLS